MNTLAPFKSRSEALRLQAALKEKRIASAIINTPSYLGTSCGLSVTFSSEFQPLVKSLVMENGLTSFSGFFKR